MLGDRLAQLERRLDRVRQPRDVLAAKHRDRRDRARVRDRVAPALLDRRRRNDDLVRELREWALGRTRHQPRGPAEGLHRLDRERRLALVRDDDEQVGVGRREHRLQRLHCPAAGLRRVERRPAAGEDDATLGQAAVARNEPQPFRLRRDRRPRLLASRSPGHDDGSSPGRALQRGLAAQRFVVNRALNTKACLPDHDVSSPSGPIGQTILVT